LRLDSIDAALELPHRGARLFELRAERCGIGCGLLSAKRAGGGEQRRNERSPGCERYHGVN
jgi:hypothetical protein